LINGEKSANKSWSMPAFSTVIVMVLRTKPISLDRLKIIAINAGL